MNTYSRHSKVKVIKVALVYEIKAYGEWRYGSTQSLPSLEVQWCVLHTGHFISVKGFL